MFSQLGPIELLIIGLICFVPIVIVVLVVVIIKKTSKNM